MKERKIAVIGDPGSVMIFKAVIYITEEAAQLVPEAIDYYTTATFPAIIPIPSAKGSLGLGMKRLKGNVEKAVGADILFKEG